MSDINKSTETYRDYVKTYQGIGKLNSSIASNIPSDIDYVKCTNHHRPYFDLFWLFSHVVLIPNDPNISSIWNPTAAFCMIFLLQTKHGGSDDAEPLRTTGHKTAGCNADESFLNLPHAKHIPRTELQKRNNMWCKVQHTKKQIRDMMEGGSCWYLFLGDTVFCFYRRPNLAQGTPAETAPERYGCGLLWQMQPVPCAMFLPISRTSQVPT